MQKIILFFLIALVTLFMVSCTDLSTSDNNLTESETILISVDYVPDEILGEYYSFVEEYAGNESEKVIFSTNIMARDFKFIEIGFKEGSTDIQYFESAVLYSVDALLPEKPLIVTWLEQGTLPHRGISFIDENNTTRYFYLAKSGEDGSLLLVDIGLIMNPLASTPTHDSSTLLQSITVTSESQIEVNRMFDNNVSSEGHFYRGEKIITEKAENITFLSFYKVDFSSFDALQELNNLMRIEFYSCNFADGITFPEIDSLEKILVSGCNLHSLDILAHCANIKHLQVAYSDIDDLGILSHFQNLETLSLIGNRVTKPLNLEPLSMLTNLEVLDLVDGNETIESLKPLYTLNKLIFIQVRKSTLDSLSQEDTEHFKDILVWD